MKKQNKRRDVASKASHKIRLQTKYDKQRREFIESKFSQQVILSMRMGGVRSLNGLQIERLRELNELGIHPTYQILSTAYMAEIGV